MTDKTGDCTAREALLKILRYLQLPFTVHGFRSSFRDWAAEQIDYPGEVAEAAVANTVANKVSAKFRAGRMTRKP